VAILGLNWANGKGSWVSKHEVFRDKWAFGGVLTQQPDQMPVYQIDKRGRPFLTLKKWTQPIALTTLVDKSVIAIKDANSTHDVTY
jgi:hypothetical protein